jgi:hypothetical protein
VSNPVHNTELTKHAGLVETGKVTFLLSAMSIKMKTKHEGRFFLKVSNIFISG